MERIYQVALQVFTLGILMLTITLAKASTIDVEKDTIYTIQLGVFDDVSVTDFDGLRQYGFVYAEKSPQGENRYTVFLSNFEDKQEATEILRYVERKGYSDALLSERPLTKGESVYVVQLLSQKSDEFFDWKKFAEVSGLFTLLEAKNVKVVTGTFPDKKTAQEQSKLLREQGFEGAFFKRVNTLQLHKVTSFNTGMEMQDDFAPISAEEEDIVMDETPVNEEDLAAKGGEAIAYPSAPTSVAKTSRESIKSLQNLLASRKLYTGAKDGVYGKNTSNGLDKISASNISYGKYESLSRTKVFDDGQEATSFENIISNIPENPKEAYAKLRDIATPMSKAYQAYILFDSNAKENQGKINSLMNTALKEAYKGKEDKAPLDVSATYAYQNLEQLVLHTRYIQAALKSEPATPCWLFVKHKYAVYSAFDKAKKEGVENPKIQSCNGFMEWEKIVLLKTISTDLNPNEGQDLSAEQKKQIRRNIQTRNKLYLIPRALDVIEQKKIKEWNTNLWTKLDARASEDVLFAKFNEPLKIAYHQAWIQLEDFYLEKKFDKAAANTLALTVLKSIVAADLESYTK